MIVLMGGMDSFIICILLFHTMLRASILCYLIRYPVSNCSTLYLLYNTMYVLVCFVILYDLQKSRFLAQGQKPQFFIDWTPSTLVFGHG